LFMNSMKSNFVKNRGWAIAPVCLAIVFCAAASFHPREFYLKETWKYITNFQRAIHPTTYSARVIGIMARDIPPGSFVLSEYPDLPLFAGCLPAISDPFSLTLVSRYTGWEMTPLINALRSKRIRFIITEEPVATDKPMAFLPQNVAQAILDNYVPLTKYDVDGKHLYVPK